MIINSSDFKKEIKDLISEEEKRLLYMGSSMRLQTLKQILDLVEKMELCPSCLINQ